jgi:hypothetical protein
VQAEFGGSVIPQSRMVLWVTGPFITPRSKLEACKARPVGSLSPCLFNLYATGEDSPQRLGSYWLVTKKNAGIVERGGPFHFAGCVLEATEIAEREETGITNERYLEPTTVPRITGCGNAIRPPQQSQYSQRKTTWSAAPCDN